MSNPFVRATKAKAKLRLALIGPSGSGKTYTALTLGQRLAEAAGRRMAVIDTERGSASLYADLFDFDALDLDTFAPARYVQAIRDAAAAGYGVVVIDSLTHAWSGKGGALEMVDQERIRSKSGNSFTAWREVTPEHNRLVDSLIEAPLHVIATMRAKTEYVMETQNGKSVPKRVGMAPIQRDGLDYEFTVVAELDQQLNLVVTKTRIPALTNRVIERPSVALADEMLTWLDSGIDLAEAAPQGFTKATNGAQPAPPAAADAAVSPEEAAFWDAAKALRYANRKAVKAGWSRWFGGDSLEDFAGQYGWAECERLLRERDELERAEQGEAALEGAAS